MGTDHPKTIRDELQGAGFNNVYSGDLRHVNTDKAISVIDSVGEGPTYLLDGSNSLEREGIQVIVRGEQFNQNEAQQRARDVMDQLDRSVPTGYVGVQKTTGVEFMGRDDDGRPRYTMEFTVKIVE